MEHAGVGGMVLVSIEERFVVRAPVERVWDHLVDPRRVVASVPGADLEEVVDSRTYLGRIRVWVGPFPMTFRGRVHLAEVDEAARRVKIVGQARESAGAGGARMTLASALSPLPGGETRVDARVEVEAAGRLAALGRGFLQELGHQFFEEFSRRVSTAIEEPEVARGGGPAVAPAGQAPLRALPLVLMAMRAWVARLLGRPRSRPAKR